MHYDALCGKMGERVHNNMYEVINIRLTLKAPITTTVVCFDICL